MNIILEVNDIYNIYFVNMIKFIGKRIIEKNVRKRHVKSIKDNKTDKENKIISKEEMNNTETIKQVEQIMDKPNKKSVKIEKKEKGLYERAEDKVTIITEDNKCLLND